MPSSSALPGLWLPPCPHTLPPAARSPHRLPAWNSPPVFQAHAEQGCTYCAFLKGLLSQSLHMHPLLPSLKQPGSPTPLHPCRRPSAQMISTYASIRAAPWVRKEGGSSRRQPLSEYAQPLPSAALAQQQICSYQKWCSTNDHIRGPLPSLEPC